MHLQKSLPVINKEYYIYTRHHISPRNCNVVKIINIIPYNKNIYIKVWDYDNHKFITQLLQDIHMNRILYDTNIYADKTDYYIEGLLYIDNELKHIWFVRSIDNKFMSLRIDVATDIIRVLDIDFSIYNNAKTQYDNIYWAGYYNSKLELHNGLII